MLSHKLNNCLLSLGGGEGVLPYMAYTGMCRWTGYGFCPPCPKQDIYSLAQVCPKQGIQFRASLS